MPELPEVEITARRLDAALAGAEVESALAPGMNVMKTLRPAARCAGRREVERRRGGSGRCRWSSSGRRRALALLIHLMSAGRLQVFDKRASLKRPPLAGADPARRRARAAAARVRDQAAGLGEAAAAPTRSPRTRWSPRSARRPGRRRRSRSSRRLIDQPRHLHPLLRDQRAIAGIGRSWVDEILWEARLSPFKKGSELDGEEVERLHAALAVLGDAIDHYEEVVGEEVPDKLPMPLQVHRREGEPCPRCGTTIEAVFFSEPRPTTAPREQTGGRVLKDRRLSRLLK